jgi:inhibitor of KinA
MPALLYEKTQFRTAGDRGLLVEYGEGIAPEVNRKVRAMAMVLDRHPVEGLVAIVPTYRALLIQYDPQTTGVTALKQALLDLEERLASIAIPPPRTVEIPVCYGGDCGPDIEFVAVTHGLGVDEVIRLHSTPAYPIYMIGFTPGFPFLGGLPEVLHTPRLETPRTHVPEGSVGIANAQTGIYPVASPGGWQLIGRTPLKLFEPAKKNPFLYQAGDCIRFVPISPERYATLVAERGA